MLFFPCRANGASCVPVLLGSSVMGSDVLLWSPGASTGSSPSVGAHGQSDISFSFHFSSLVFHLRSPPSPHPSILFTYFMIFFIFSNFLPFLPSDMTPRDITDLFLCHSCNWITSDSLLWTPPCSNQYSPWLILVWNAQACSLVLLRLELAWSHVCARLNHVRIHADIC